MVSFFPFSSLILLPPHSPTTVFYLGYRGERKDDLTDFTETQVMEKLRELAKIGEFLPKNTYTLDGEFAPKDIDIVDYEMWKRHVILQREGL